MIDQLIRDEAKKFASFWNAVLIDYPILKLDGTWPSIGIIDKILFPLRAKERFDKSDIDFIKGAAAYIGIIAHNTWSTYEDLTCDLIKVGEGSEDYLLKAKGGKFLPNESEFNLLLCKTIENILKNSNKEINYFAEEKRFYTFEENIISSVSSGLVSGLTALGQGSWAKLNQKQFEKNLISAARLLSEQSVKYYQERFSGEEHGQNIQLYLPNLVLPPLKYNEPHIGARSTAALCNFCITKNLSNAEIQTLLQNLSVSPDDTISTAAYILACSMFGENPPEWLLFLSNARGITNPLLRPACIIANKAFNKKDFVEELEANNLENATKKINAEYNLGFLPLFYLPKTTLLNELPSNFLYFISWSSAKRAHDLLDTFHIFEKLPEDLALQLAFLKINCGLIKEAEDILSIHFENKEPEDREIRFRYFEIKSLISSAKNDQAKTLEYVEEAILTNTTDSIRFATVGNQLARIYLQTDNHEQAVILTEKITEKCPWWISAHITKLIGLLALKRNNEIDIILAELSPYFSVSNNLFSFLKAYCISKVQKN